MRFVGVCQSKNWLDLFRIIEDNWLACPEKVDKVYNIVRAKKKKLEHIHNIGIKLAESLMRYSEQRATHRISARL